MTHNKAIMVFSMLALALFGLFLTATDPVVRGIALWLVVLLGLCASLALSWRDFTVRDDTAGSNMGC